MEGLILMKRLVFLAVILLTAAVAQATDISFQTGLTQGEFHKLAAEAGGAIAFRNAAPAAPLGVEGFDIGISSSFVDINSGSSYWKKAFTNDAPSVLPVPAFRVRKGLPYGVDVGAMYAYAPNTNIKVWGVEASKALIDGGAAVPSVAMRGSYTWLAGVGDLQLQTGGIDLSVSKGFLLFTPYAGIGGLMTNAEAKGNLTNPDLPNFVRLKNETIWQARYFAGVEVTPLPLVRLLGEIEYCERPIYTIKASVGF